MIRITRRGTDLHGSTDQLNELRIQFSRQHYLRLPELIGPDLLDFLRERIEQGEFYERVHQDIGPNRELCLTGNTAAGALICLLNDERLFQMIQTIAQCDLPRCFEGRIYRVIPNHGHHDSWHDDIGDHRLVGLSVNLSGEVYAGGVLQVRNRESGAIMAEVANVGAGDGLIFRLSRNLEHRITEVEGDVPKTAFAGWFKSQPDTVSFLRAQFQAGRKDRGSEGSEARPYA